MASIVTLAVGDGTRRMSYAELADTRRDPAISALKLAVEGLCEQLEDANQRAERAEERADRADQRADRLHGELVEARAAERKAIDLVRYATAEASDQRKRADDAVDAERIARDEAAGLRAELDARRTWGLRRRLRWALGRRR
jgi:hypothetical protein